MSANDTRRVRPPRQSSVQRIIASNAAAVVNIYVFQQNSVLNVNNALKARRPQGERRESGLCRSRTGRAPLSQPCEAAVHHWEAWLIFTKLTMSLMVRAIRLLRTLITILFYGGRVRSGAWPWECASRGAKSPPRQQPQVQPTDQARLVTPPPRADLRTYQRRESRRHRRQDLQ